MENKNIACNGVELFAESIGASEDVPILLVMGAMSSGVWWPEEFCRRLAGLGRFVIRYDHRDTGKSTSYEPGDIRYSVEDLADDVLSVMDGYGLGSAHLVGMSLGGFLSQLLALRNPERVRSLTLIASEPLAEGDSESPPIDPAVLEHHSKAASLDWTNREAVVEYQVGSWRLLCGSAHQFDEAMIREMAGVDFDRTPNMLTPFNHALLQGGEEWMGRLDEIAARTLIIHGTEDKVLPYSNALKLKEGIADSALLSLDGSGHELHPEDWGTIIGAIERHTSV
ncbi:alpha/beta hydrolase [bacterium]|nr:MAG: alpha/beta hydrolase [bacterium]